MQDKYFLTEDQLEIQTLAKDFADHVVAKTVTEKDLTVRAPARSAAWLSAATF